MFEGYWNLLFFFPLFSADTLNQSAFHHYISKRDLLELGSPAQFAGAASAQAFILNGKLWFNIFSAG